MEEYVELKIKVSDKQPGRRKESGKWTEIVKWAIELPEGNSLFIEGGLSRNQCVALRISASYKGYKACFRKVDGDHYFWVNKNGSK